MWTAGPFLGLDQEINRSFRASACLVPNGEQTILWFLALELINALRGAFVLVDLDQEGICTVVDLENSTGPLFRCC